MAVIWLLLGIVLGVLLMAFQLGHRFDHTDQICEKLDKWDRVWREDWIFRPVVHEFQADLLELLREGDS